MSIYDNDDVPRRIDARLRKLIKTIKIGDTVRHNFGADDRNYIVSGYCYDSVDYKLYVLLNENLYCCDPRDLYVVKHQNGEEENAKS